MTVVINNRFRNPMALNYVSQIQIKGSPEPETSLGQRPNRFSFEFRFRKRCCGRVADPFPFWVLFPTSKLWVPHSARCSQGGKEECRGFLVLILSLSLVCGTEIIKWWKGGRASCVSIIQTEFPLTGGVAHILAAHPPNIAESGAPSSWVHQRTSRARELRLKRRGTRDTCNVFSFVFPHRELPSVSMCLPRHPPL